MWRPVKAEIHGDQASAGISIFPWELHKRFTPEFRQGGRAEKFRVAVQVMSLHESVAELTHGCCYLNSAPWDTLILISRLYQKSAGLEFI
jgi:hypothetical protein